MKKVLYYAACLLCVFSFVFMSCSQSGQDLDYKKACEEKDFLKAYQIVDKLKEETSIKKQEYYNKQVVVIIGEEDDGSEVSDPEYNEAKKKSDEAERYVILQEAMFVLETQGTNGLIRIIGIAKEHNAEEWLYSELADIARKIGDSELEERINNLISPSPTM